MKAAHKKAKGKYGRKVSAVMKTALKLKARSSLMKVRAGILKRSKSSTKAAATKSKAAASRKSAHSRKRLTRTSRSKSPGRPLRSSRVGRSLSPRRSLRNGSIGRPKSPAKAPMKKIGKKVGKLRVSLSMKVSKKTALRKAMKSLHRPNSMKSAPSKTCKGTPQKRPKKGSKTPVRTPPKRHLKSPAKTPVKLLRPKVSKPSSAQGKKRPQAVHSAEAKSKVRTPRKDPPSRQVQTVRQSPTVSRSLRRPERTSEAEKVEALRRQAKELATSSSSSEADSLRSFLLSPSGVTVDPAAFQLRCKQAGADGKLTRKVAFVVDGSTKLWKLNQVIAECFDAAEGDFNYEAHKGSTAVGSRFVVSRPMKPGQCDKALICSQRSATHAGSRDSFVDDKNYSVAQLFRGKSTRQALERAPAEAAQEVVFSSPKLASDVSVTLDGIMLDRYDNQKLFDKKRRHCNGSLPLPRVVRSSFMTVSEIEAKNIVMQGQREGPDFLLQISSPWSAMHETSRKAQRKPLFRKDGRDYDLHDLCYIDEDEESATEDEHSDGGEP